MQLRIGNDVVTLTHCASERHTQWHEFRASSSSSPRSTLPESWQCRWRCNRRSMFVIKSQHLPSRLQTLHWPRNGTRLHINALDNVYLPFHMIIQTCDDDDVTRLLLQFDCESRYGARVHAALPMLLLFSRDDDYDHDPSRDVPARASSTRE